MPAPPRRTIERPARALRDDGGDAVRDDSPGYEASEPVLVIRLAVVIVAAIATITLVGWATIRATDGLFDDDEACEGDDCPPSTTVAGTGGAGVLPGAEVAPTVTVAAEQPLPTPAPTTP